jgi:hypothetical protein
MYRSPVLRPRPGPGAGFAGLAPRAPQENIKAPARVGLKRTNTAPAAHLDVIRHCHRRPLGDYISARLYL